jgi:hypothetical protein
MIAKEQIIKAFTTSFILKDRRERCYFELTNFKKRFKFINKLNHQWDSLLDMRFLSQIEKEQDHPEKVKQLLKLKDDELCYVVSSYDEYDDKVLPFGEVFDEIYAKGLATLLISTTGETLYLDTELERGGTPRFIGRKRHGE